MFGNIGSVIKNPPATPGSSPNLTGTNIGASSNPAGALSGLAGAGAGNMGGLMPSASPTMPQYNGNTAGGANGVAMNGQMGAGIGAMQGQGNNALHGSGLPNQPPSGINPQLWSSVLQHLGQTNFGQQPRTGMPMAPRPQQQRWSPLPSMQTQPVNPGALGFMGVR